MDNETDANGLLAQLKLAWTHLVRWVSANDEYGMDTLECDLATALNGGYDTDDWMAAFEAVFDKEDEPWLALPELEIIMADQVNRVAGELSRGVQKPALAVRRQIEMPPRADSPTTDARSSSEGARLSNSAPHPSYDQPPPPTENTASIENTARSAVYPKETGSTTTMSAANTVSSSPGLLPPSAPSPLLGTEPTAPTGPGAVVSGSSTSTARAGPVDGATGPSDPATVNSSAPPIDGKDLAADAAPTSPGAGVEDSTGATVGRDVVASEFDFETASLEDVIAHVQQLSGQDVERAIVCEYLSGLATYCASADWVLLLKRWARFEMLLEFPAINVSISISCPSRLHTKIVASGATP